MPMSGGGTESDQSTGELTDNLYILLGEVAKDLQSKYRMFNRHCELRAALINANVIGMLSALSAVLLPIASSKRARVQQRKCDGEKKTLKTIHPTSRQNSGKRKMNCMVSAGRWLPEKSCFLYHDASSGYGVKLARFFRNEFAITRYTGLLHDKSVFDGCPSQCTSHALTLGVANWVLNGYRDPLDALKSPFSSLGSFINHATGDQKPNCYLNVFEVEGQEPVVLIIARGYLPAGTILLLDYGKLAFATHHETVYGGTCSGQH